MIPFYTTTSLIKTIIPVQFETVHYTNVGTDAANRFLDLIIGTERVVLMWNRINTGKFGHDLTDTTNTVVRWCDYTKQNEKKL